MTAATPDTPDLPYQSLYRRFRPSTFAGVRGQDHVVLALRNAVRDGRVAHAYLFSGPRGTGKTSTARILAMSLNCTDLRDGEPCGACPSCTEISRGSSLDVHELDAASNNGVEAMRDLVARAALGTPGRQKVYIVDEVHMLSTAASNALLKTLEEPPPHVVFVLATTDPQKVLPTIRSRTQHFEFRLLGPDTLGELLGQVRHEAGLDLPDEAIALAVRRGRGSARDALSVLDQVLASDSVDDDLPELDEIVEALAERDPGRALAAVAQLAAAGYSPQQLTVDLLDHLRQGFLVLVAPELVSVAGTERDALGGRSERVGLAALVRALEVLGLAQVSMRDAPDPRVDLEVALVRLAHPDADVTPEALLARIERLEAARTDAVSSEPARPAAPRPAAPRPAGPRPKAPNPGTPTPHPETPNPETPHPETPPAGTGQPPSRPSEAASTPGPEGKRRTVGAVRRESAGASERPATPALADPPEPTPAGGGSATLPDPHTEPTGQGNPPDRDQLVQAWGDQVIGRLRPKAKALFQAGRFMSAEGDRAEFGLPNEIHRTRCQELRPEVEGILSDHFGCTIHLDLVVDPGAEALVADRVAEGAEPTTGTGTAQPRGSTRRVAGSGGDPVRPEAGSGGDAVPPGSESGGTAGSPRGAGDAHAGEADGEDLSAFDESELGEVAVVDNSAPSRVLRAFPGAEEVT